MLLLFKKIIFGIVLFTPIAVLSQVEINKPIEFVNTDDSLRQIYNIGIPGDSSSLINFKNATSESLISIRLSGSGNYSFQKPFTGFSLVEGMQLNLLIDTTNSVSTPSITFESTNYPLKFQNGDSIPVFKLENNSIARVIFNGTEFRLAQYFRNTCPPGFVSVNENYCIEINERPLTIYTNAINICNNLGGSLCSWGEWYYACSNLNNVVVFNMQGNWEFIDDASDHSDTYAVVGNPSCMNFFSENVNLFNRNFRCCYRK